jgi:hypothetical protein
MYASLMVVALSFVGYEAVSSPSWMDDYRSALTLGREVGKPLAVFISSGKGGWDRLCSDSRLSDQAKRLLASSYVCMYVNTDKEAARQLAADFEVRDGPGLVISDRTGGVQAFRHEGELKDADLVHYLKRYSDPERVAQATETVTEGRVSYYRSATSETYVQPVRYAPSFVPVGRGC